MKGKKRVGLQRKNHEYGARYLHPISAYRIWGDGPGK